MQQVNHMGQIYGAYAPIYAASGQAWVGLRALATVQGWLDTERAEDPPVGPGNRREWRAVDLGCGGGEVAVALDLAGHRVTGVDRAPAMLAQAAIHAAVNGADVAWSACDLREWRDPGPYDLAVSFYDTLNYITEPADLAAIIRQVGAALAPGGIFAFDLNTPAEYATWPERSTVTADSERLFVYNVLDHDDDGLATGRIVWFERDDGPGGWRRGEETHLQRGYADETVIAMLSAAGLTLRARLAPDGAPADPVAATRIIYIAQR